MILVAPRSQILHDAMRMGHLHFKPVHLPSLICSLYAVYGQRHYTCVYPGLSGTYNTALLPATVLENIQMPISVSILPLVQVRLVMKEAQR